MRIKELPISERPYEKLEIYGAEKLSNAELLAIIIKTGTREKTVVTIAQEILNLQSDKENSNLRFLQDLSIENFMKIKGIGKVKAIQLKAVCELTKRISRPISNKIKIKNSKDVADLLMPEMRYEKREVAKVLLLNSKNIVLKVIDISLGGANFACLEPKDVLSEAVKMQVPKIILVHNHPSGDARPSKSDFTLTERLYEAAELIGIDMLDHIVIGDGTYESIFRKD
ncbi:MAG: DNA repair protein RadC [Clostridia bacterium]